MNTNEAQKIENKVGEASDFMGTNSGGTLKEVSPLQKEFLKNRNYSVYQDVIDFIKRNHPNAVFTGRGSKFYDEIAKFAGPHTGNPAGGQQGALIDLPLSDTILRYENGDLIAKKVLTDNPVPNQTGRIAIKGQEHSKTPESHEVLVEGGSRVSQLNTRSTRYIDYRVQSFALKDSIAPSDRMNYIKPFMAEQDTVTTIKDVLMLICEKDLANKFANVSVTGNANQGVDFDNLGTDKDLIAKKQALKKAMIKDNGLGYNTIIMDLLTFESLRNHPDIIGNFFQTNIPVQVNKDVEMVAKFFEISPDRLLVAGGYTTATVDRDADKDRVWGKDIYFAQVAPKRGKNITTLGFNHNYGTMKDYVLRRESPDNPQNQDFFVYSNWGFDIIDTTCLGKITTQNV